MFFPLCIVSLVYFLQVSFIYYTKEKNINKEMYIYVMSKQIPGYYLLTFVLHPCQNMGTNNLALHIPLPWVVLSNWLQVFRIFVVSAFQVTSPGISWVPFFLLSFETPLWCQPGCYIIKKAEDCIKTYSVKMIRYVTFSSLRFYNILRCEEKKNK